MRTRSFFVSAVCALCLVWAGTHAWAQDKYWSATGGGNFTNAINWTGGLPGLTDNANFNINNSYQVDWTAGVTNNTGVFDAPGGAVTLNVGAGNTWTLTTWLRVGMTSPNAATVLLNSGSIVAGNNIYSFTIGQNAGSRGSVTIANGARIASHGYVEVGRFAANSTMVVTDPGSVWTNDSGGMFIGNQGTNNLLIVTNGGKVYNGNTTIESELGRDSNSSRLLVTGAGSLFRTDGEFFVGHNGSGNRMEISSGGRVESTKRGNASCVGFGSTSTNNTTIISGSGSIWDVNEQVFLGKAGANNLVIVTNAGQLVSRGYSAIGQDVTANSNTVIVTGTGSAWTNTTLPFFVGNAGSYNKLIVTNGGRVVQSGAPGNPLNIARSVEGRENLLLVSGTNSLLQADSAIIVGANGDHNHFVISDGATVLTTNRSDIGAAATASNNTVLITDPGSQWVSLHNSDSLYVSWGNDCQVTVANGGKLFTYGNVGTQVGTNQIITVTDPGSVWSNTAGFVVLGSTYGAVNGYLNQLAVSNGGTVYAMGNGVLIGNAGASGSLVRVTGTNSLLKSDAPVYVSNGGNDNQLDIANGGRVLASAVYVGSGATTGNWALVTARGILDANTLVVSAGAVNSMSNRGGVYQFGTSTPTITPNGAGRISVTNGTISHRDIVNADVFANWNNTLASIAFSGTNTFRLNNASTRTDVSQTYTFATGLGATNYARLELLPGAAYRNGDVTIGSGGSLAVFTGASSITNLALQSGGTFEVTLNATNDYSQLTARGTVALGNATLQVNLGSAPVDRYPYLVISKTSAGAITPSFQQGGLIQVSYGGTNYFMVINYAGGDNNDLVLMWRRPVGTIIAIH